jgi:hypothetical protein
MLEFTSRSCGDSVQFYALYPADVFTLEYLAHIYTMKPILWRLELLP